MRIPLMMLFCVGMSVALAAQTGNTPGAATAGSGAVYSSDLPPSTPELTLEQRADLFIARRDYTSALELLLSAVKEHQANGSIYNRIGIAYQQLDQLGQASKYYKLAIRSDRAHGEYYNNLGTIYYEQKKYSRALEQYRQAIQRDATSAAFYVNLGSAEFALKQYAPAMDAYRQALQIDPNALFPQGSSGLALEDLNRVDEPRYHYELAKLFCSLNQLDDAMHQFHDAMDLHYSGIRDSLTDPAFARLRARPDFRVLMNLPPLPSSAAGNGGRGGL